MKNSYRVDGDVIWIRVATPKRLHSEYPASVETQIDATDLAKLMAINCTWAAQPAKASKGKFYVIGKVWNKAEQRSHTKMFHQIIMGEPKNHKGKTLEVHHEDNDGLNNRRKNLWHLTHQDNMRAAQPDRNWQAYDSNQDRIVIFKKLVAVGEDIGKAFGLSRQQMWGIRTGRTKASPAAKAYWNAVSIAIPELFRRKENRTIESWIVGPSLAKPYCVRKQKGYDTRFP